MLSKNRKKIILLLFLSLFFAFILSANFVFADNLNDAFGTKLNTVAGNTGAGYNTGQDVDNMIALIIQVALSLLGAIFLILMIYGGYSWMTAQGEEAKVEKAKKLITAAFIGLIIVLAAYAISIFVISKLEKGVLDHSGGSSIDREELIRT